MSETRQAWIIAPKGPGTARDRDDISAWFESLPPAARPATVMLSPQHKAATSDRVYDLLHGLSRHDGLRWVWIVGHTGEHRGDKCLETDDFELPLSLAKIGLLLVAAANAKPGPVIAVVDVCHAGKVLAGVEVPDNLALFMACDDDQLARATTEGGWLTQRALAALGGSACTPLRLAEALTKAHEAENRGDQHPVCLLGRHAGSIPLRPGPTAPGPVTAPDLTGAARAAWRDHMSRAERYLRPLFGQVRAVDEVFVELAVATGDKTLSLADLLAQPGAYLIDGAAGAGKTTLARRHAARLAEAGEWLPVYLPLAGYIDDPASSLWAFAQSRLEESAAPPAAAVCAALPAALTAPPHRVCLLLDGLDEVAGPALKRLRALLQELPQVLPGAVVAVFTRPLDDDAALGGYQAARVQPLNPERQQRLLTRWLGDDAPALWQVIQGDPRLAELAGTPLLLTLLALVGQGRGAPKTKAELYHSAVDVLLSRPHRDGPGLPNPQAARAVLRHLSLALQIRGGEAWPANTLRDVLERLLAGEVQAQTLEALAPDPEKARVEAEAAFNEVLDGYNARHTEGVADEAQVACTAQALVALRGLDDGPWALDTLTSAIEQQSAQGQAIDRALTEARTAPAPVVRLTPESAQALHGPSLRTCPAHQAKVANDADGFLRAVARQGGLLVTPDGEHGDWTFLHRALRDALAAELLAETLATSQAAVLAHATGLGQGQALGRWGETYALLVAQAGHAAPALLAALTKASPKLALRAALGAEASLPPEVVLHAVLQCDGDGEALRGLAEAWREAPERLAALQRLATGAPLETAARVFYALGEVGALGEVRAFFRAAGLLPPQPELLAAKDWVDVPAGRFQMGADDLTGHERPVHQVAVSAFKLGRTAVTVAQLQQMAPKHPGNAQHPVTNVSWYVARLFAAWAGASLPTEAEWEHAARGEWGGGAEGGAYWFGDDEARLAEFAWCHENSERKTHQVGTRKATAGGLLDLYGHVREWCEDWHGPYPTPPKSGVKRVLRGGGRWDDPVDCRSAYRDWLRPVARIDDVGFRLCRRPSAALDH